MEGINSGLKSVNQLLNYNYHIPSYQRGYRWTPRQVTDLLDDIWSFSETKNNDDEYYCLQPIVINKIDENTYTVIDGQQRLTTILIILRALEEVMKFLFPKKTIYQIEYETRPQSAAFLADIQAERKEENIDYFHMCEARDAVLSWFDEHEDDRGDFLSTLLRQKTPNVQVIWYEPEPDVNPIEVFTRLNMGKIGLTNAELIKALFLSSAYDMSDEEKGIFRRRQDEIAAEWDRFERSLREEEYWGFLQNNVIKYDNHIELLFDLMAKNLKDDGSRKNLDGQATFLFFDKKINSVAEAWNCWDQEVKPMYQLMHDWWTDHRLYHLYGFLIAVGVPIGDLIKETQSLTKRELERYLHQKIKDQVPGNIDELTYQDRKPELRKVILLFNVLSILEMPASNFRFQFARYKDVEKGKGWDIEHIHAVKSEMPDSKNHRRDWLEEVLEFSTSAEIVNEVKDNLSEAINNREAFEKLYDKVWDNYASEQVDAKSSERDVNDISNLTLLDSGTNRGYRNAIFPIKRRKIIEKEVSGTFIPLCTKNVFLKYYNRDESSPTLWGARDRKQYRDEMMRVLHDYLKPENHEQ